MRAAPNVIPSVTLSYFHALPLVILTTPLTAILRPPRSVVLSAPPSVILSVIEGSVLAHYRLDQSRIPRLRSG